MAFLNFSKIVLKSKYSYNFKTIFLTVYIKSIQATIYNGVRTIDRKKIYITIHEGIPIKWLTVNSILLNHFKGLIWFDSVCQHQPKLPKTACQNWWLLEKYAVPCVTNRSINCPCKYSRKAMHRKNAKETKINFCHFLYRLETLKKGRNINIFVFWDILPSKWM